MKVNLTRAEINFIILGSYKYKGKFIKKFMTLEGLTAYDSEEIFSQAIELQLIDLNRGVKSMFQFYLMSAKRNFFKKEKGDTELKESHLKIESEEILDEDREYLLNRIQFANSVNLASENLSYYHYRGFLQYIKTKVDNKTVLSKNSAEALLIEYITLIKSVSDIKRGSVFYNSNNLDEFVITEINTVHEIKDGLTFSLEKRVLNSVKDLYSFNEAQLHEFVIKNKLTRRSVKTLSQKQLKEWKRKIKRRQQKSTKREKLKRLEEIALEMQVKLF